MTEKKNWFIKHVKRLKVDTKIKKKTQEKNHWQRFIYLLSMFAKRKVLNDKK